jgi:preprotein translocase subunit Sss1
MTNEEALRQQLQAMIEKSKRVLHAAKEHLAQQDHDFA